MNPSRGKIFFVGIHDWNSPVQVGVHHIARQFLKHNWRVAYISAPITPLHLFSMNKRGKRVKERWRNYRNASEYRESGRLWSHTPFSLIAPDVRFPLNSRFVLERWQNFSFSNLKLLISEKGFDSVDILFFDSIFQPFWLDFLKYRKCVFRIRDANSAVPGFSHSMKAAEKRLAKTSDAVFYSAKNLAPYVRNLFPQKAAYLPNGVEYSHFDRPCPRVPKEYLNLRNPIVLYVGVIDHRFDIDLVHDLSVKLPYCDFVLIGPAFIGIKRLCRRENVHCLGSIAYDHIPKYMKYAHVGIVPFRSGGGRGCLDSISPLKMIQYFASGLPTVTSAWDELTMMSPPASICHNLEEFSEAIASAIDSPPDAEELKAFARRFDWGKIFRRLNNTLF